MTKINKDTDYIVEKKHRTNTYRAEQTENRFFETLSEDTFCSFVIMLDDREIFISSLLSNPTHIPLKK